MDSRGNGLAGVITAVATPFLDNLSIDQAAMNEHIAALLKDGSHFVSPFGTTGEANSISCKTRMDALEAMVASGISPTHVIPGTGACPLDDARLLTRHACELGVAAILLLPSFYYANPAEDGLVSFFSPLLEIARQYDTPVILYNIPQFTQAHITPGLLLRLRGQFGGIVAGVKDSSGDWNQTKAFLELREPIAVFPGSEALLEKAMPLGAAGCISGSMNVTAALARAAYDALATEASNVTQHLAKVRAIRMIIQNADLIPAVKAILEHQTGHQSWGRFAPPLTPLDNPSKRKLVEAITPAN